MSDKYTNPIKRKVLITLAISVPLTILAAIFVSFPAGAVVNLLGMMTLMLIRERVL
jgi:hypothetical protein